MPNKPATNQKELMIIEKSIIKTMREFRKNPRSFWSTSDIQCCLKVLLLKGKLFRTGPVGNVFLNFPTRNTYEHGENGTLLPSAKGKIDHFALAGWISSIPTTWNHVTQQLSFAVEIEYFPVIPKNWEVLVRNDLLRLSDDVNGVPAKGRFFLLLTIPSTSIFRGQMNALFEQFPSVRCYQQIA